MRKTRRHTEGEHVTVTVADPTRKNSTLVHHDRLLLEDAEDLALVYLALGYDPSLIEIADETGLLDRWPA